MISKYEYILIIFSSFVLFSCSKYYDKDRYCKIIDQWVVNDFKMPDTEEYIIISVEPNSYQSLGYTINTDLDLAKFIKKQYNYSRKLGYYPPHLFLRSDKTIKCERFQHSAKILKSNYPCTDSKLCIWAYGLGNRAQPFGIPPPPPDRAP